MIIKRKRSNEYFFQRLAVGVLAGLLVTSSLSLQVNAEKADVQYETIDDIRNIVQASTESSMALFAELSDSQLEQPLDFNGFVAPGRVWLNNMVDHEIHHKGQLFTYVRSLGIERVPFFIMQPSKQ